MKGKYVLIGKPKNQIFYDHVSYWMQEGKNIIFGQTMLLALKDYECKGAVLFHHIHPITEEEENIIHTLLNS